MYDFLSETEFDYMGVFSYSAEEGTKAAKIKGQLTEKLKEERKEELIHLQSEINYSLNCKLLGKEMPVIIDEFDKEAKIFKGRTYRDAPEIDGMVKINKSGLETGKIYDLTIREVDDF